MSTLAPVRRGFIPRLAPPIALLLASIAFRWPALINASTVDSDAAIVGLQAMHILRGEWAWFLFGSGYQTSVDSTVAAGFFALLGATPLVLMLSTFVGHLTATGLAFGTVRRHVDPWLAALLTLPLVFTPSPLHTYILGPPRQAAITLVFLSVWTTDGAARSRAPHARYFAGAAVASLACYADPYALLFLPPLVLLSLLASLDSLDPADDPSGLTRAVAARAGSSLAGAALGFVPFVLLVSSAKAVHGETTFTVAAIERNYRLLTEECLPWILSTTVYTATPGVAYAPWHPGTAFRLVQWIGAFVFVLGIGFGLLAVRMKDLPWPVRRLGVFGFSLLPVALGGFLVSVMVMDLFSARYLAALVLVSPFALTPSAYRLGRARFGVALLPYVVSAAVAGWVGFGVRVAGAAPVHLPGSGAEDEAWLESALAERGVTTAVADYWVSYRLTFLYREALRVIPVHASEDRYPPYREAFARASRVAYIFDSRRSRETFGTMLDEVLAAQGIAGPTETLHRGDLTAVVLDRPPGDGAAGIGPRL
jgi:hypothetical protein